MAKGKNSEMMRLDKFLSSQMNITRSEAKEYLKSGKVTVDGKMTKLFDAKVDPSVNTITCMGKEIGYRKFVYIMLNKPSGVICATKDELSETVLELIPEHLRRKGLFPAGRLDKDTEGFVFITDDGVLAHRMLSPVSHVEKRYYAELEHEADDDYIKEFESGMTIDGGEKCLPAGLEICENRCNVFVTLCEGKYHQIKRMFEKLGNRVVYLKRLSIGGIKLDENLPLGECREITGNEIDTIYNK